MHRPCPDCVRRSHRQVRLMQRWATTTKTTLPSPPRTPNSKGKGKMPVATTSRDRSERRNMNTTTTHAVNSRTQILSAKSSRRGPAAARRNDVRNRAHGTPSITAATPTTLQTITSPRPCRAPTFSPHKRRRKNPPTTAPTQSQTGTKRQRPYSVSTTPNPKRHRQQHGRNPDGRRDLSANHDNPTGNTMAPTARSGGSLPAAPRRLDVWATSAPPSSPPEPDRATTAADRDQTPPTYNPPESDSAATDRDQAPLTTCAKQNADKRRRAPDQDADRPTYCIHLARKSQ